MKKVCLLVGLVLFNSCSNEGDELTIKEEALAKIKANASILDEAFSRTAQILQAQGDLRNLVSTFNTRDAFITHMNTLVDKVVVEVIESHATSGTQFATSVMEWDSSAPYNTSIQNNLKQIQLLNPSADVSGALDLYSTAIDGRLDALKADIVLLENQLDKENKHIHIESFSFSTNNPSRINRQLNAFVVTFDRPVEVKEAIGNMVISYTGLEDLDGGVEDFVNDNPDTEVLIALLLPAIQVVRDNPTATKSSFEKLTDLIMGTANNAERDAWNKRVRYAAFLAGLDFIISKDFQNNDEYFASIPVQRAMHHGVTVLAWGRVYDAYH